MIMVGVQLVHHLRQQFGVAVVRAQVRFVHCREATLVGVCGGGVKEIGSHGERGSERKLPQQSALLN